MDRGDIQTCHCRNWVELQKLHLKSRSAALRHSGGSLCDPKKGFLLFTRGRRRRGKGRRWKVLNRLHWHGCLQESGTAMGRGWGEDGLSSWASELPLKYLLFQTAIEKNSSRYVAGCLCHDILECSSLFWALTINFKVFSDFLAVGTVAASRGNLSARTESPSSDDENWLLCTEVASTPWGFSSSLPLIEQAFPSPAPYLSS